ncbi:imidazole glycerol phosphate synthase subunit HisH [Spirosoma sp. BT702]|uniref:Imidazole glycerol phosphate synthase subunit HisH n=1 Tax=Spirosoma profusum TaxID=2771354 RepID=A0A926XYY4_9BACT|nr:imidazole glycerol phosphate synthase subunit HisH [Spirosoma profusum]MBD2700697.1 imidazole glycerol phosphate synthase subunit HisH [Spirosoma profusum]
MRSQTDIVIIDYGMGNLRSVQKKFDRLNALVCITSDSRDVAQAQKLVLPGVGHFATGVKNLKESGIWDVLQHKILVEQIPIFGICLGMQLMARSSEEGNVAGLGWFDADVVRFQVSDTLAYKVPHMGWNTSNRTRNSRLLANVPDEAQFYFVHSYHMVCQQPEDVLTMTTYNYPFVSAIEKGNIYGTQFHPEKSHDWGEQMIANFIAL